MQKKKEKGAGVKPASSAVCFPSAVRLLALWALLNMMSIIAIAGKIIVAKSDRPYKR